MEKLHELSVKEAQSVCGGEILTLTLVLTYLAVSILTVIVWKLYTANQGKVSLPGGALFQWDDTFINPIGKYVLG
ncbi:MAG: hypothetical protein WC196_00395 [Bacilli bacterium]|jgi:hypothetical protein|nr:hypothetical protein [Bacilli bacterium]MDD3422431.1 hypothetical protein [Bacilli bacterium]MDD4066251.1 hypothetical protein [Bacilli bacterium]